jgi:hypothetical protein
MTRHEREHPSFQLGQRVGSLERGSWYLAIELSTGRPVMAAVATLDPEERAQLASVHIFAATWSNVSAPIGVEHRADGATCIGYPLAPGRETDTGVCEVLPTSALDEVSWQLREALMRMHDAGLLHGGLTRQAIELVAEPGGEWSARLRGVGIPALPGRTPQDDLYELTVLLYSLVGDGGAERESRTADADLAEDPTHVDAQGLG